MDFSMNIYFRFYSFSVVPLAVDKRSLFQFQSWWNSRNMSQACLLNRTRYSNGVLIRADGTKYAKRLGWQILSFMIFVRHLERCLPRMTFRICTSTRYATASGGPRLADPLALQRAIHNPQSSAPRPCPPASIRLPCGHLNEEVLQAGTFAPQLPQRPALGGRKPVDFLPHVMLWFGLDGQPHPAVG